jgi:hypothetical protein
MVTVTDDDGSVLGRLEFGKLNLVSHEANTAVIHPGIMSHCTRDGLWYRVAHAASWLAEVQALHRVLQASSSASVDIVPLGQSGEENGRSPSEHSVIDDDLYQLQRDQGETDGEYRERALMLRCDERGYIRLPKWKP